MTKKEFLQYISGGKCDVIGLLLEIIKRSSSQYCVIGGLAVNAYAEPLVSLDLDIVVVASSLGRISALAVEAGFKIEQFPHSVNLSYPGSDIRIQLRKDPRYQDFLSRGSLKQVLGYELFVASLHDVFQGKLWAYQDTSRRASKRQKDLADILRLIEGYPELNDLLPPGII